MVDFFKGTVTPKDWAIVGGIVALAVLLCVGFYFQMHTKQLITVGELRVEDEKIIAQLEVARDTQKRIDSFREDAGKMRALVTQFEKRLPKTSEIPTLLKTFEDFAQDIDLPVDLQMLTPITEVMTAPAAATAAPGTTPTTVTTGTKQTIPYTVKAKGTFDKIVTFINKLERYQRYLKVSDLKIATDKDSVAVASFVLSTFLFEQEENEGGTL